MSNWLFERSAFTVGRIEISPNNSTATWTRRESGINDMIKIYDQITGFTWSSNMHRRVRLQISFYLNLYYIMPSCPLLKSIAPCRMSGATCSRVITVGTIRLRSQCPRRMSNLFLLDFLRYFMSYEALATVKVLQNYMVPMKLNGGTSGMLCS
jgi:hypothetical protein